MTVSQIIIILCDIGSLVMLVMVLPRILSSPIARIKRIYMAVNVIALIVLYVATALFWDQFDLMTSVILVLTSVAATVQLYFLQKLDYYLDDLLYEGSALVILGTSIMMQLLFWSRGLEYLLTGFQLRLGLVAIALLTLAVFGMFLKTPNFRWSVFLFIVLLGIKSWLFPYWGVWLIAMLLIYSIFTGYVVMWGISATRTEKIYSQNVNPTVVGIIVIVLAGIIVLAF